MLGGFGVAVLLLMFSPIQLQLSWGRPQLRRLSLHIIAAVAELFSSSSKMTSFIKQIVFIVLGGGRRSAPTVCGALRPTQYVEMVVYGDVAADCFV